MKCLVIIIVCFLSIIKLSLIAMRPTLLTIDTSQAHRLIPLDPQYENMVLTACSQGDAQRVCELLKDKDQRSFSEDLFKYAERAFEASLPCRSQETCIVTSALAGTLAALFTQSISAAECPCLLIPFGGCVIGTFISGVPMVMCYSQKDQELVTLLHNCSRDAREKAQRVDQQPLAQQSLAQQPPRQLSMQFSQGQVSESQ